MDKLVEFFIYLQGPGPYLVAFAILIACGLGLPIPEDIILFSMGLLSYYGLVDLKISIVVCLTGVLLGDLTIYMVGRHFGVRLIRKGFFARIFPTERMEKAKHLFHRWGNKLILGARFMPGLRAPIYFSAGTLHLPWEIFVLYDAMAACISVPLFISVIYRFGDHVDRAIKIVRKVQNGLALAIFVIVIVFLIKHYAPVFREKLRRKRKRKPQNHHH